jgi:hypothetical protein
MYARFHKNLIVSVVVISLFHLLVFLGGVFMVFHWNILPDVLGELTQPMPQWMLIFSSPESGYLRIVALAGVASMVVFSVLANLGVRTLYRRTDSAELLFLMLFCLSLCLEAWRLANLVLPVLGMSPYLNVVITRLVLFARFFGLLCLLVASLYAVGMKYVQYPVLIGGMAVLSFALAGVLPLDTSLYEPTFLFKLGDRQGYLFVRLVLALLMVINFVVAARIRRSRRFAVAAVAVVLLFVGRELLQHGVAPVPAAVGAAALIAGFVVYVRQVVVFYLGF